MWNKNDNTIPALICEGGAERAIIDLLLDNDKLLFSRDDLLSGDIIKERDAPTFQKKYLRMSLEKKIVLFRVLDSRRENFRLGVAYRDKVSVKNVITAPEIEMLYIISVGKYSDYMRVGGPSAIKPSDYCIKVLKAKRVKKPEFITQHFKSIDFLIDVLKEYKRLSCIRKGEYTITDLLK